MTTQCVLYHTGSLCLWIWDKRGLSQENSGATVRCLAPFPGPLCPLPKWISMCWWEWVSFYKELSVSPTAITAFYLFNSCSSLRSPLNGVQREPELRWQHQKLKNDILGAFLRRWKGHWEDAAFKVNSRYKGLQILILEKAKPWKGGEHHLWRFGPHCGTLGPVGGNYIFVHYKEVS